MYLVYALLLFHERKFIVTNNDDAVTYSTFASELVANAHFFHDVTQAIDILPGYRQNLSGAQIFRFFRPRQQILSRPHQLFA